jgi:predicted HTH domain antitoxin
MPTIEVPGEIYEALNIPEEEREEVLRRELAVSLYDEGILSFGKARELAGLSHREFHRLLGEREIERHYTAAELDEDTEFAREP